MKRRITFACRLALAAVAVALTLGACQKEENISGNTGELMTLRVEVENQGAGGGKMETEGLNVYWSAGDLVRINDQYCPITLSGGNACVENLDTAGLPYWWNCGSRWYEDFYASKGKAFNAYFPSTISAPDEYDGTSSYRRRANTTLQNYDPELTITLPSRYESGFAGGRQQIDLPMVGTYYFRPESPNRTTGETVDLGRSDLLRFQHVSAGLLVKVRNDSGLPLLVDRVAVSSGYYKLSGQTTIKIETQVEVSAPSEVYRSISKLPEIASDEAQRQVEVVFPEPVVVAPGDTLPVQVPILPMGPSSSRTSPASIQVTDNLTITVEGRNESNPGIVGGRKFTFKHTVEIPDEIGRNQMKTIQIKMDPESSRVTTTGAAFSVDDHNKVLFSQGNLQYNKATQEWSFMEHQWSTVETDEQNVGENYADQDIVSLFGWGTSGHDYSLYNYQPYSTEETFAYGPIVRDLTITDQTDWGWNAIANGGNTANSGWFTLSSNQWDYLLGNSATRSGRHTLATVNGVPGLLLLPDDWDLAQRPLTPDLDRYTTHTYAGATWQEMETLGAVFLPAASIRNGTLVSHFFYFGGECGFYWSATSHDSSSAYALFFEKGLLKKSDIFYRFCGAAVRLVRYAQ